MRRLVPVVLIILLCVFCFGCASGAEESADAPAKTEQGVMSSDPYESVGDPRTTPAYIFLITVSAVIAISAAAVLIRDSRRKGKEQGK